MSLLVRRQKHADVISPIQEMLKLDLQGEPIEHIGFAQMLLKHRHFEQAMSVGYSASHNDPHGASTHSAYFGLVLMNTRTGSNGNIIPVVDEIANDCWFEIQNDEGERHEFVISNEPQTEPLSYCGPLHILVLRKEVQASAERDTVALIVWCREPEKDDVGKHEITCAQM